MKIVFFSADPGNHRFINPIIEELRKAGHDTILLNNWTIIENADVYWFDFCDNNLIVASRENKEELSSKIVIARLHAVEYYMGFHNQIDWSTVDHLIFVSVHLCRMCGELPVQTYIIPNGIALDKLVFRERRAGKVIGYAGNIVPTKGILIMFHYFRELLRKDPEYRLKMVGLNRFHGREGEYFDHYRKDLPIEISEEVSDINEWMEGIDYLWQPSLAESFSIIVGEAMAKGIKPLINNFYGSEELWPKELIYNDFTSFYNILTNNYESQNYRDCVEQYSLDSVMESVNAILQTGKRRRV